MALPGILGLLLAGYGGYKQQKRINTREDENNAWTQEERARRRNEWSLDDQEREANNRLMRDLQGILSGDQPGALPLGRQDVQTGQPSFGLTEPSLDAFQVSPRDALYRPQLGNPSLAQQPFNPATGQGPTMLGGKPTVQPLGQPIPPSNAPRTREEAMALFRNSGKAANMTPAQVETALRYLGAAFPSGSEFDRTQPVSDEELAQYNRVAAEYGQPPLTAKPTSAGLTSAYQALDKLVSAKNYSRKLGAPKAGADLVSGYTQSRQQPSEIPLLDMGPTRHGKAYLDDTVAPLSREGFAEYIAGNPSLTPEALNVAGDLMTPQFDLQDELTREDLSAKNRMSLEQNKLVEEIEWAMGLDGVPVMRKTGRMVPASVANETSRRTQEALKLPSSINRTEALTDKTLADTTFTLGAKTDKTAAETAFIQGPKTELTTSQTNLNNTRAGHIRWEQTTKFAADEKYRKAQTALKERGLDQRAKQFAASEARWKKEFGLRASRMGLQQDNAEWKKYVDTRNLARNDAGALKAYIDTTSGLLKAITSRNFTDSEGNWYSEDGLTEKQAKARIAELTKAINDVMPDYEARITDLQNESAFRPAVPGQKAPPASTGTNVPPAAIGKPSAEAQKKARQASYAEAEKEGKARGYTGKWLQTYINEWMRDEGLL